MMMGLEPLPRCLQTKKFMVGRTKTTAVCLKDGEVSQRHAELLWSAGDGWTLTDKGSSNGTKVNGATIKEGGAYRAVKRCTSPSVTDLGEAAEAGDTAFGVRRRAQYRLQYSNPPPPCASHASCAPAFPDPSGGVQGWRACAHTSSRVAPTRGAPPAAPARQLHLLTYMRLCNSRPLRCIFVNPG